MSKPADPAYHWNGAELDLDAYLARIGFDGERAPTVRTLHELVRAHTTAIPFENLEIILGRTIPLDLATLQDKMVHGRRGGYCYENVGLFAAALERLGFGVTGLSGRVSMGAGAGLRPPTTTGCGCATSASAPDRSCPSNCPARPENSRRENGSSGWSARAGSWIPSCGYCTSTAAKAGSTGTASP
jgi:hypothetical protein